MDLMSPGVLLGGLSPAVFMRRHWQRRPLLVRQAWPGVAPPLARAELFAMAGRAGVEARLVERLGRQWQVRHGPLSRRALPPVARAGWTLLVQGLDLHVAAAHRMLAPFRFIPAARLDDLMMSWASPGGGVGPHADSYDVFLLQVQGQRRWRVAPPGDGAFRPGLPLKILRRFEPQHDWVLEPGDMLYLPPLWGHDGTAVEGECMTCSIGFRAPAASELARELLLRLADADEDRDAERSADRTADRTQERAGAPAGLYGDATQRATAAHGAVPPPLQRYARRALAAALADPARIETALGELLSEPKPQVWFEPGPALPARAGVWLDARTRMLHDGQNLYVNGESYRIGGRDAPLLRRLADARSLTPAEVARLSRGARAGLQQWARAGWLHGTGGEPR